MTSGIKIKEIVLGTGTIAERPKIAVVHVRAFLNRGDEFWNTYGDGKPVILHLSERNEIPGLLKGIEGMRVGGKRELVVSPHLALIFRWPTGSESSKPVANNSQS